MQQQMFPCPRCGWQNAAGQKFCANCGAGLSGGGPQQSYSPQQMYSCPVCHQPVAYGVQFCGSCRTPLNWPTQQVQPPSAYEQRQQGATYQDARFEKSPKKTSPWIIGFLALIGIAILIGGGIFAFDRFSQGTSSSAPSTASSTQTPPETTVPPSPVINEEDYPYVASLPSEFAGKVEFRYNFGLGRLDAANNKIIPGDGDEICFTFLFKNISNNLVVDEYDADVILKDKDTGEIKYQNRQEGHYNLPNPAWVVQMTGEKGGEGLKPGDADTSAQATSSSDGLEPWGITDADSLLHEVKVTSVVFRE